MKKDSPRRKIVDAIDFMTDNSFEQQIIEIPIDEISDFKDHPFHLYEGKRLDDMVESIKKNGILNPVIIRKQNNGEYEMLAGHNRMNASLIAGFKTVPAFIKENITDEEAYIYVIETNLMQRSFNDMYPTEKAIVLELRYEKVTSQGKRTDIRNELRALENGEISEDQPVMDSRGRLAKEYGLSGRTVARLLRLNSLTEDWKLAVDNEVIGVITGVELSYISENFQEYLFKECEDMEVKLSLKDAKSLKELYKQNELDENIISKLLLQKEKGRISKKSYQNIKLSNEVFEKYFDESSSKDDVKLIIESALENYFADRS
jgi:ParB family chromosome partitioning protein